MRLRTNIFLWVFLATVIPLTAVVLGATAYSERLYRQSVARDVHTSLSSIVSEIDRSLYYERQLVLSLASGRDLRPYLPVLEMVANGELHPTFFERGDRVREFLSGLHGLVPNFHTLRVLDVHGNTLVKVSFARSAVGLQDGIESLPYAEPELLDAGFARRLAGLAPGELSFLMLPDSRWDRDGVRGPPMLAAGVPLVRGGQTVGYLLADFSGEQLDRILELAPRVHKASLMLAEISPELAERDGLVLYGDRGGLRLSRADMLPVDLQGAGLSALTQALQHRPYGDLKLPGVEGRLYYLEYLPYPNQFTSWVLAAQVDEGEVSAPFRRIRVGILVFAAVAVLLSLLLAQLGARRIAAPIAALANGLTRYADGDRDVRVVTAGPDEIRQVETSFNYMAETLERARSERDRAQGMLLQNAKLASLGHMAAGIGHEINNPLNNILSLSKLIQRELPRNDPVLGRDVEALREEALRASGIVQGVLNFARQVPPEYTRFPLGPWLRDTLALAQQAARARRVQLVEGAMEECELEGDRAQLQQVLINLLLNAIQASPAGGRVELAAQCDDRGVALEVRDHGPGIPSAVMEQIFDPFFTTKGVGEGSGLGLSISLGIVERHQGSLTLENAAQGGVRARMFLPLSHATPAASTFHAQS